MVIWLFATKFAEGENYQFAFAINCHRYAEAFCNFLKRYCRDLIQANFGYFGKGFVRLSMRSRTPTRRCCAFLNACTIGTGSSAPFNKPASVSCND